MATLVFFHAHPDDEAITTGGCIAKYSDAGHRVVLVIATGGEHGERPDDLAEGETLADRRRAETARAAEVLGIAAVKWLGYEDSGMTGWEQNANANSFHQAPVEEAAEKLAGILREEGADVLTHYDWHGVYGHPDHVKVHHVGHRAGQLAGTPTVYQATYNRDVFMRFIEQARESGELDEALENQEPSDDGNPFGSTEAEITTEVDVRAFAIRKRNALTAHRSQVSDSSFFLEMPDDRFITAFGTEWFIREGAPGGIAETELI
jgi:LmbE family N-acetylglucosaminyl deacetylase